MAKREDGAETRSRILNSACELFAEKGYRGARVADICERAGANVAAVNYYFGDKAALYTEAWQETLKNLPVPNHLIPLLLRRKSSCKSTYTPSYKTSQSRAIRASLPACI